MKPLSKFTIRRDTRSKGEGRKMTLLIEADSHEAAEREFEERWNEAGTESYSSKAMFKVRTVADITRDFMSPMALAVKRRVSGIMVSQFNNQGEGI